MAIPEMATLCDLLGLAHDPQRIYVEWHEPTDRIAINLDGTHELLTIDAAERLQTALDHALYDRHTVRLHERIADRHP